MLSKPVLLKFPPSRPKRLFDGFYYGGRVLLFLLLQQQTWGYYFTNSLVDL